MKFLVDEMPNFTEDCPFNRREWDDGMWVDICTLNDKECNLHETYSMCHGLKRMEVFQKGNCAL